MLTKYKTVKALLKANESGEIPAECVSPGGAARALGVSRQAISERMYRGGSLDVWMVEDGSIILISEKSIRAAQKKRNNVPDSQGELRLPEGGANGYA